MTQTNEQLPTDSSSGTKSSRKIAVLILVTSIIGLFGSLQLIIEKSRMLADPNYIPSCSLNPILSCGTVMNSWQASVFGPPNAYIGATAFAILIIIGIVALFGVRFPRWFWLGLQLGVLFGIAFISWLMFQSIFSIEKLCLYCIVVWIAMIPLFVGITLFNLRTGIIPVSQSTQEKSTRVASYSWAIVLVWYAIVFAVIIIQFPGVLIF